MVHSVHEHSKGAVVPPMSGPGMVLPKPVSKWHRGSPDSDNGWKPDVADFSLEVKNQPCMPTFGHCLSAASNHSSELFNLSVLIASLPQHSSKMALG